MMYQKTEFPLRFIREANCQILELPYVGKDLSMLIMLPNEITGLTKVGKINTFSTSCLELCLNTLTNYFPPQ